MIAHQLWKDTEKAAMKVNQNSSHCNAGDALAEYERKGNKKRQASNDHSQQPKLAKKNTILKVAIVLFRRSDSCI